MSASVDIDQVNAGRKRSLPWSLWLRQLSAIMRLEVRKNFFAKRSLLIYPLAAMPIGLLAMAAVLNPLGRDMAQYQAIFSIFYNALILHTVVFFGCAWIFMNLFRGDLVDRSLHYYFLSSVRREVLVVGKYASGLLTSIILFTTVTIVSHMLTYAGITILACVGYGAFFLVVGLFFRNPIVPALVLYFWEWINFLLPPLLKKISVIHYLNSLVPVPLSEGPFAVVGEPTPAWISVPGLVILTALVLFAAGTRIRRMEIRYGSE